MVIFISPFEPGGVLQFSKNSSQILQSKGISSRVITFGYTPRNQVSSKYYIQRSLFDSKYKAYKKLSNLIPKGSICFCAKSFELEFFKYYRADVNVIYVTHGDNPEVYNNVLAYGLYINLVWSISKTIFKNIHDLNVNVPLIQEYTYAHFNKEVTLESIKSPESTITLIYIGRVHGYKGFEIFKQTLYEIDQRLTGNNLNVNIVLGGKVEQLNFNFKKIRTNVYWNVENNKVHSLLNGSDLILMPSLSEGLPIALIEAFTFNVIPIVSGISIFKEILEDGFNFLINYENKPKVYADIVQVLMQDDIKRRKIIDDLAKIGSKFNENNLLEIVNASKQNFKYRSLANLNTLQILDSKYFPRVLTYLIRRIKNGIL